MTPQQGQRVKALGGYGALAVFIMGANWAAEKITGRHEPDPQAVTNVRFVTESIAVRSDLRVVVSELRDARIALQETNSRLREICNQLRAGCR